MVTGGTFYRTYSNNGSGATNTRDPATVSSFRLDKYEMTVGRFRQYVNYLVAGGSPPAAGSGKHMHLNDGQGVADSAKRGSFESGWNSSTTAESCPGSAEKPPWRQGRQGRRRSAVPAFFPLMSLVSWRPWRHGGSLPPPTSRSSASWNRYIPTGQGAAATWTKNLTPTVYGTWTANAGDNEMLPLTFMNWYEAHAFCIWDGGFLPTEAEWKYATAGGDEQRMYPWGSMDPGSGNQYAIYDCYYPSGRRGTCTGVVNVPDVGSTPRGVGRYGQWDLSGSVWEWNLDVYANYVSPCEDCANLTGATNRVLPGGGFHTGLMPYLLSSNRSAVSYDPANYRGDYGVGVRCARTP
ncbi:SUMF1/EgtB/PvdO family nonheme iron enzyme [Sorangium sp. So ce448]|uniref:formylglycine-generating enzyme family protein n=1 Tax=Sorangium sp. So ce448 TaxID=3133314 RepID=UPI003F62815C